MNRSLAYYVEGRGFAMKHKWEVDGKVRWCWLELGGGALMLQEFFKDGHDSWAPAGKPSEGVSLCFICEDAVAVLPRGQVSRARRAGTAGGELDVGYRSERSDGYRLFFESPTDTPEATKLSEAGAGPQAGGTFSPRAVARSI